MKTSALVLICAALAFGAPGALAQSATVGATVDAGVDATVGSNGVDANASANGSVDAGANANGSANGNGNGNGTDGAADANSNANAGEMMKCEETGAATSIEAMGQVDVEALKSATNVTIVPVANCDDTTRSALAGEGGTNIRKALDENAAVDTAIKGRGATMSDVIGATVSGDTVTVYVESEDVSG